MLLLDEIAAHLDAGRRAALYGELTALGAQTFMSGTGAELFGELGDQGVLIEVRDADGATELAVRPS